MSVWVIIPIKPLKQAKSRLASVITPEQRQQFAQALLRNTLETVQGVPQITGTLVISRDSKALAIAREYKAFTVMESGAPELNAALMRAAQVVSGWRADAVLVLPADLPLITREDISAIIDLGRDYRSVVIATDEHEDGTNALMTRPPGMFAYAYGAGSYQRHMALARAAGAAVKVYHSERLMLDVDLPEDLERYIRLTSTNGSARHSLFKPLPDNAK
ncbi:MAG: 2-phospho-L-lactate guanylyltransferase [Chloroflexi bacterium]|nr:2-phospho-L-lactate guanylyltransferase [Chloroflexota bacterium]